MCPHDDPTENAIGGAIVGGMLLGGLLAPVVEGLAPYIPIVSRFVQGGQCDQKIKFAIHPRVLKQLQDTRLGELAGKLTPDDLQRLVNNPLALRARDMRPDNYGNINVIQEVGGIMLRITTAGNDFKIISVGPIRANQVQNLLNNGGYKALR